MIQFKQVHVYHYCALKAPSDRMLDKTIKHGIAHLEEIITDLEQYERLLQSIVGEGANTYGWAITSLSYLGEHRIVESIRTGAPKP